MQSSGELDASDIFRRIEDTGRHKVAHHVAGGGGNGVQRVGSGDADTARPKWHPSRDSDRRSCLKRRTVVE